VLACYAYLTEIKTYRPRHGNNFADPSNDEEITVTPNYSSYMTKNTAQCNAEICLPKI
jgi:hypothetical protein